MVTRNVEFATGEFYHVYNRGVDKRIIFLDQFDHQRFLELLYLTNTMKPTDIRTISRNHSTVYEWDRGNPLVAIGAYCLMPNHFHILATPLVEKGVGLFMNKLCTSYSMYFNKKYHRSGALFQGRYKAEHATNDTYLKYLYSYIHLNPLKLRWPEWKEKGLADASQALVHLQSYPYSSYLDYWGFQRKEVCIIDSSAFPEYFTTSAAHLSELKEWLGLFSSTKTENKD